MAKCPVCYTVLNAGTSGWTDDPIKTPRHRISNLRGTTSIRAKHILELQQKVNGYEAEFSTYPGFKGITNWTQIQARKYSIRPQYINQLRQAIEGFLGYVGYSLSDYLSQDLNGEPTRGISGWTDGNRLSSKINSRAIHIEEVRLPFNIPDLIVTDITITNQGVVGGRGVYDIAYTVKNDGYRKAPINMGRLELVGSSFFDSEIRALGPVGNTLVPSLPSEVVIHTTWHYDPLGTPVAFQMKATADINSIVKEIKESNNSLTKDFFDRLPIGTPDLIVTDIVVNDLGIIEGNGTYDITYTVKNIGGPSIACNGLLRMAIQPAYIIVHAQNPEGKEIEACSGGSNKTAAYENGIYKGVADGTTIYTIEAGTRSIRVTFNGMEQTKEITIGAEETQAVIFTFARESIYKEELFNFSDSFSWSAGGLLGRRNVPADNPYWLIEGFVDGGDHFPYSVSFNQNRTFTVSSYSGSGSCTYTSSDPAFPGSYVWFGRQSSFSKINSS